MLCNSRSHARPYILQLARRRRRRRRTLCFWLNRTVEQWVHLHWSGVVRFMSWTIYLIVNDAIRVGFSYSRILILPMNRIVGGRRRNVVAWINYRLLNDWYNAHGMRQLQNSLYRFATNWPFEYGIVERLLLADHILALFTRIKDTVSLACAPRKWNTKTNPFESVEGSQTNTKQLAKARD